METTNYNFTRKPGSNCYVFIGFTENGESMVGYAAIDMADVDDVSEDLKEENVTVSIQIAAMYAVADIVDLSIFNTERIIEVASIGNVIPEGWHIAAESEAVLVLDEMRIVIIIDDQTYFTSPIIHIHDGPAREKVASDLSIDLDSMTKEDIERMEATMAFRRMIANTIAKGVSFTDNKNMGPGSESASKKRDPESDDSIGGNDQYNGL